MWAHLRRCLHIGAPPTPTHSTPFKTAEGRPRGLGGCQGGRNMKVCHLNICRQANLTSEVTIGLFVMAGWNQVWVIMLVTSWPITWRGLVTKFAFLWGNKVLPCDFWRILTFAQNHHIRFMWWGIGCSCVWENNPINDQVQLLQFFKLLFLICSSP